MVTKVAATYRCGDPVRGGHHGGVPVPVGAQHRDALAPQLAECRGVRMAVVVGRPHRQHRQPGVSGFEELGQEVGRTVVRHLEDVGGKLGAGVEQSPLGGFLDVAGQQNGQSGELGPQHQ